MPSPGAVAKWENEVVTKTDILTYTMPAQPQYYEIYCQLPNLMPKIKPLMEVSGLEERVLVDVAYEAFIIAQDPSINTSGFIAAELGYIPGNPGYGPPQNLGYLIPNLDVVATPLAAEAYEAITLPVGGVNYPIWTRATIDPLSVTQYADDTINPASSLWGMAFVQLNGNSMGGAITVIQHLHWSLTDPELTQRPLLGVVS